MGVRDVNSHREKSEQGPDISFQESGRAGLPRECDTYGCSMQEGETFQQNSKKLQ